MNALNLLVTASATLSVVIGVYSCIPFIQAILNGKTKPHQMTWLVFTIMNGMVAGSQFLAGARLSVLLPGTFFLASLGIVALSFRYGVRDTSRYDKLLFSLSLMSIIIWAVTRNNVIAIWLTVAIDIFATAMTILKIKALPDSEHAHPWTAQTTAYVFTYLSLGKTPFGILYIRPIYGLLSCLAVVVAIYYCGNPTHKTLATEEIPIGN